MTKEEILHLGTLARIRLTDAEADSLRGDISSILEYVSAIDAIVADTTLTKRVGARFNIFRADEVTNEPGEYTEALMAEMPEMEGRYLKVRRILNPDN